MGVRPLWVHFTDQTSLVQEVAQRAVSKQPAMDVKGSW